MIEAVAMAELRRAGHASSMPWTPYAGAGQAPAQVRPTERVATGSRIAASVRTGISGRNIVTLRRSGAAQRLLGTLFEAGAVGGLTDGELLERFVARDGITAELAFAALVERHGPLVERVCRGVLRHEQAAEDAFQSTFLVLVKKASSLAVRSSLAPGCTRSPIASRAMLARARRDG